VGRITTERNYLELVAAKSKLYRADVSVISGRLFSEAQRAQEAKYWGGALSLLGPVKSAPVLAVNREDIRRVYTLSIIRRLLCLLNNTEAV